MIDASWFAALAITTLVGWAGWIIRANQLSAEIRLLSSAIDTQRHAVLTAQRERKEALDELWRVLQEHKKPGQQIRSFKGGLPYLVDMTPTEKRWAKEWVKWNKRQQVKYPW